MKTSCPETEIRKMMAGHRIEVTAKIDPVTAADAPRFMAGSSPYFISCEQQCLTVAYSNAMKQRARYNDYLAKKALIH